MIHSGSGARSSPQSVWSRAPTRGTERPPFPSPHPEQQQPNHHSKPPTTFAFLLPQPSTTPPVNTERRMSKARSVIITKRVEPRVQMDAFPGEETDQGSFTPPFPPSNGRASGSVAPPPSAMHVDPFLETETDQKRLTSPFWPTNG